LRHKSFYKKDDPLGLAARRLLDGGSRDKAADALMDYTIGPETLLMQAISAELSYRFALRGATVLAWGSVNKRGALDELRGLYNIRSRIAHGVHVAPSDLRRACEVGERSLRSI
jgi:hypothetical protein